MRRVLGGIARVVAWVWLSGVVVVLDYPAVTVQCFVFVLRPSVIAAALLAGALVVSLSARYCGSGGYLGLGNFWARMFLIENSGCSFLRVPLEAYEHLLPAAYCEALKQPFSLIANPRELSVCLVQSDDGRELVTDIVSFRSLSGAAFVFVPDHPRNFTTFQKFAFMRELDHVATPSRILDREAQKMVWILSVIWLALLADWHIWNAAALLLIFAAYEVLHVSSEFGPESPSDAIIREQIKADHAALDALSEDETCKLDEILAEYPLSDPQASDQVEEGRPWLLHGFLPKYTTALELSNDFRTYILRSTIAVKRGFQIAQQEMSGDWPTLFQGITVVFCVASGFAVAYVGQRTTSWRLWTAGILAVLLFINANYSWRYIRRSRRIIHQEIAERVVDPVVEELPLETGRTA